MIKPTVGRVVWFWDRLATSTDQPQAAIIVYVDSDSVVNLAIFQNQSRGPVEKDLNDVLSASTALRLGSSGTAVIVGLSGVLLWQGDSPRPSGVDFCEWMPFQIGQAARLNPLPLS